MRTLSDPTAEEALALIKGSLENELQKFVGHRNTTNVISAIKSNITGALYDYERRGLITRVPLVDVNHTVEIAHLESERERIFRSLNSIDYHNEHTEYVNRENEMVRISMRIDYLKGRLNDPNGINVNFKDPDTFEEVDFRTLITGFTHIKTDIDLDFGSSE